MKKALLFLLISMNYCSSDAPSTTSETLAVVNHRTIEKSDFLNQTHALTQVPGVDLASQDGRINILKDMVNEELIFQDAIKNKFYDKNAEIKHTIVREYLKNQFGDKLPVVSDADVEKFYTENQRKIDLIRASHILISLKPKKKNPRSDQEARAIAEKVRMDILNGKISFQDAVKKYSEDTATIPSGGDLSFFPRAKMVENFSKAAFDLKKIGDISQVVKTNFGYHIIMLTGEQRGFDLYKEKIRWKLYQDIMQPQINEYFTKLKEGAKIKLYTERLAGSANEQ